MTRRPARLIGAAAVLVLALSACTAEPAASPSAPPPDLGVLFTELLREEGVPGGALAIRKDGETTLYPAGEASAGVPVDADTVFAWRSVTKSLTVTALLQLAEEGLVDLDAADPAPVAGIETTATPAQLAGMVSGVPNYSAQDSFHEMLTSDLTREFTDDELFALVAGQSPDFAPGTSYEYSNTNTLLIGRILQAVTGDAWSDVVTARITEPLGLTSVVYPGTGALPAHTATPYQLDEDGAQELPMISPTGLAAAGGLYGTAEDLVTWAEALGTGSLLSPAMQAERVAAFTSTTPDPHSPLYQEYGLGIGRMGDWIGHTGNGVGFQSLAMHDPATGISVAICINATGADPDLPLHMLLALEDAL